MADPTDIDPNAPAPAPWSWVPDSWRDQPVDQTAPADVTVGYEDAGKIVPARNVSYTTKLAPKDEQDFQKWVKAEKVPFDSSARADYDMRGYWLAKKNGDPRAATEKNKTDSEQHYPDTWKTPFHKTFSDESIYATPEAASWRDDKLVDHGGKVLADESPPAPIGGGPMQPGLGIPMSAMDVGAHAGGLVPFGPQQMPSATAPDQFVPPPQAPPDVNIGSIDDGRFVPANVPFGPPGPTFHDLIGPVTTMAQPTVGAPYGVPVGPEALAGQLPSDVTVVKPRDESVLEPHTDAEWAAMAERDPHRFIALQLADKANRENRAALEALQQSTMERAAIENDHHARELAMAHVQKKQDENNAAINAWMAKKIDPNRYMANRSNGRRIADFIGAIAGGAAAGQVPGGNGVNHYTDDMQKLIEQDISAQESDLRREGEGLQRKNTILAEEFARTGSLADAKHVATMALMQSYRGDLLTKQQEFDPAGRRGIALGQAIADWDGRMAQQQAAKQQQDFKNGIDIHKQLMEERKANAEDQKVAINWDKNNLEWRKFGLKSAVAGGIAGGPTNPDFTVPTGVFDPFTGAPVMGKRELGQLGGKVKDPEEPALVNKQLTSYYSTQEDWAELARIAVRMNSRKNAGGMLWKKFEDTDTKEFNGLRHKLAVDLVIGMGDKLTAGQIESQGERVPELNSILESRDVVGLIKSAQERSDRDFAGKLRVVGVDGESVIKNAQRMRKPPPEPPIEDEIGAAQEAVQNAQPGSTGAKDAAAQLEHAKERARQRAVDEVEAERTIKAADAAPRIHEAAHLSGTAGVPYLRSIPGNSLPPSLKADIVARDEAVAKYEAMQKAYAALKAEPSPRASKNLGEHDQAISVRNAELAQAARKVMQTKQGLEDATDEFAHSLAHTLGERNYGGIPPKIAEQIASDYGKDPGQFERHNGNIDPVTFAVLLHKLDRDGRMKLVREYLRRAQ